MDRTKFKTRELAKTNKLVRLAILEAEISELNHNIELAQIQERYWLNKQAVAKAKIAKKYEYHKLLQKDNEPALIIDSVSVSFTDRLFKIAYDYESSVSERMEQIKALLVNER